MKKFIAVLSLLVGLTAMGQTLTPAGRLGVVPGQTFTNLPKIAAPYTTVVNRAKVTDFSKDLMPKFGIDRTQTQQIMRVMDEQGPNGEPVFKPVNDIHDQVRFVGEFSSVNDSQGQYVFALKTPNNYAEITFYGTGLNVLTILNASVVDYRISIDGGPVSSNIVGGSTTSSILQSRNYSQNAVVAAASGLSQGVHTIKLWAASASGLNFAVHGFEIINSSSPTNITLAPGSSYINGQKLTKSASSTTAYNSNFESGTLGTRGGHVLVYQKKDGAVAKAVTPTDAAAAYLTSASHTNEEIVRTHNWREFGAGRADDASLVGATATNFAFTLDDGTTTLVCQATSAYGAAMAFTTASSSFCTLTFVGTGIDLALTPLNASNGTAYIDGASLGTLATVAGTTKVASGLPYGTHTLKVTTGSGNPLFAGGFIIYAPKTPTLPAGAVALADYFVMADFNGATATGTAAASQWEMPTGTVFKSPSRELVYTGANWGIVNGAANVPFGWHTGTGNLNTQPADLSFVGTGVSVLLLGDTSAYDVQIYIDGALNASGVTRANAAAVGGGTYRSNTTTAYGPSRIEFTGLTYGPHTVRVQRSAGVGNFSLGGYQIITPIHAPKTNGPFVVQNTLSIGSQSIRDLRQFSVAQGGQQKMVAQAVGVSSPTYSVASPAPLADLSATVKTTGCPLDIRYAFTGSNSAVNAYINAAIYVNGASAGSLKDARMAVAGYDTIMADSIVVPVAAGTHKVDVYWQPSGGGAVGASSARNMTVREICN